MRARQQDFVAAFHCPQPRHVTGFVTVQYLHSHEQKSMKIAYGNGIFACQPMFSYGQRSKCADLLNSYQVSPECGDKESIARILARQQLDITVFHGFFAYLAAKCPLNAYRFKREML